MRKIFTGGDPMEAHFVRGLLEQIGIEATVLGEILSTARGELPFGEETLPSVWVKADDVPRALPIVEAYAEQAQRPKKTSPQPAGWTCPECREAIDGQFTDCWQCGAGRPDADSEEG